MWKIVFTVVSMVAMVFADGKTKLPTWCNVVGKGIVKCDYVGATHVYHLKKDVLIEKAYHGNPSEQGITSKRTVSTYATKKIDFWPCLELREIGDYKVVHGNCLDHAKVFLKKVIAGEDLQIIDLEGRVPMQLGSYEFVGVTVCESTTTVTTFEINKFTGWITNMNVYDNLKPGTYCEDFVATDALYWKP